MLLAATFLCLASGASANTIRFHGTVVQVPVGWPVFDLSTDPSTCVRFNRHAIYLGSPSKQQRCPASAIGRTEAILVSPSGHVTATWNRDPGLIRDALHRRTLRGLSTDWFSASPAPARGGVAAASPRANLSRAHTASAIYTGLGFDVCSAPSESAMTAWKASPYRAIGIYLGGVNSACSQPNLTASWVSDEIAAGWHLIPTYVGLQAPNGGSSCGSCGQINPSRAQSQGAAAAADAMSRAQAIGIGRGNPIYYDMEAYATGGNTTTAVRTFLAAWTAKLHASGYLSGVYSSGASGIADLVAKYGTSYTEPDDLWVADWNNRKTAADPYVPAADWPSGQRIHQYSGGQNVTYRHVTLDIDGDYLDGATVGQQATNPTPAPTLAVKPVVDGSVLLEADWPGASGISGWQVLAGFDPTALAPLGTPFNATGAKAIKVHSQLAYYEVQALDSAGQPLGASPQVAVRPHLAVFGHSAWVPAHGYTGIPVGCYTAATCHVTTTITAGNTTVGTGGRQFVRAAAGGMIYVKMTAAGRSLLAHAPGHHLPVTVKVSDSSGIKASTTLNLIAFSTSGRAPARSLTPGSTVRIVAATDFAYRGSVGGILAACSGPSPCLVTTTITAGRTTIAAAGPQFLGTDELGYLTFRLSAQGRAMLLHAHGDQLGAKVTLSNGTDLASGRIALVSYR
jgi:hypothetical protein